MDSILQICEQAKDWLRPPMFFIATALVTCTLVACSDVISKHLRILTSKWPKVFRTLIFILVTAFGYGSAIVYLTPVISKNSPHSRCSIVVREFCVLCSG